MANPLYQQLMGGAGVPMPTQMPDVNGLMQQVNQIAASFPGDPRAAVQNLINSGQMTQQQFNQFAQMANTIMGKARKR